MKDVAKILATIYGRQPTQPEIDHVRSIASVLGISGNDEFTLFLACLIAYRNIFEQIPELTVEKVQEAARLVEKSATESISRLMTTQKEENDRIITRIAEITERQTELVEAINEAGEKTTNTTSMKKKAAWICGTALVCFLLFGTAIFMGFKMGEASGLAQTRKEETILKKHDNFWESSSFNK